MKMEKELREWIDKMRLEWSKHPGWPDDDLFFLAVLKLLEVQKDRVRRGDRMTSVCLVALWLFIAGLVLCIILGQG